MTVGICPGCGKVFTCGIESGESWCWCFDVDASSPPRCQAEECYCEACITGWKKPSLADILRRISKDT